MNETASDLIGFTADPVSLGRYLRGRTLYWHADNNETPAHTRERCEIASMETTADARMASGSVNRAVREGRAMCTPCLKFENDARTAAEAPVSNTHRGLNRAQRRKVARV